MLQFHLQNKGAHDYKNKEKKKKRIMPVINFFFAVPKIQN